MTSDRIAKEDYVDTAVAAKASATLTSAHLLVGNVSNVAADVAVSGDVTITNAGVTAIGASKVTNAMIAAVDGAKITTGTVPIARLPTGTGSSNVPLGGVITGAGPTGDASHTLALTYNAAGQLTAVTNNAIAIAESAVTGLVADLALKAPLASPALTGTPTAPTQTAGDASTAIATDAFVTTAVNNAISGLDVKPDVAYVSLAALPANTYANGASGVGATLTGNANGPLVIDGVTLVVGQAGERVLVAAEATSANNGWYTITQVGVVAVSPYILTRATESDQATEIGAGYLTGVVAPNTVVAGTNNGKLYISVAADPFTVGTTALTFSQVGGTYGAGNGLTLTGSTFSIDALVTVDKTTAQTLTNKTLTSPAITTPTGIVKGDVGLGNVDNTSNATERAATATLTNKALSDTTTTVVNVSDATKVAKFDLSGATTGKTATLALPITLDRTITFPNATDTLVGKATTDTLTNKTLTSAVLNTGVSGTAVDTDSTMAANSDTILASQKAIKTALALKAPLAAPQFTGVVNIGGPSNTFGTALCAVGSISNEGTSGFAYVYTAYSNSKAGIDLRSTGGTSMSALSHTTSGTIIGGVNFGGSTDTAISLDCAQIICLATQDFSATAAGSQLQFWTNPNNVANGKVLALTIDQDQTATFASSMTCGAITASGAIVSTSTLTFVGNLVGTAFAAGEQWTGRRANGSSGSETQVLSGQQLGSLSFQGYNNSNGGYLTGAQIAAVADETFTTTGFRGTRLTVSTGLSSTNVGAAVRLILDNAGKLWWGATTGAANASVDQTGNASFGGTLGVTGAATLSSTTALNGDVTIADATNVILNTSTGTKIGTGTTQKLGFLNATPVAQQANSVDLGTVLSNFGLRASGGNPPLNLGTGALTAGTTTLGATTLQISGVAVKTANYTLIAGDAFGIVTMNNASARTITIPANSSVAYATGTVVYFYNLGAGTLTLAITTDTLTGTTSYAQNKGGFVIKTASTTWLAFPTA